MTDYTAFIKRNKLDVIGKLIYIEKYLDGKKEEAEAFYRELTEAITKGAFAEPDCFEKKHCFADYVNSFNELIDDINKNGFDRNTGLGGHRAACIVYWKLSDLPYCEEDIRRFQTILNYDLDFFLNSTMSYNSLLLIVLKYSRLSANNIKARILNNYLIIEEDGDSIFSFRLKAKGKFFLENTSNVIDIFDDKYEKLLFETERNPMSSIKRIFIIVGYRLHRLGVLLLHSMSKVRELNKFKSVRRYR